jgi:hypothetical protein
MRAKRLHMACEAQSIRCAAAARAAAWCPGEWCPVEWRPAAWHMGACVIDRSFVVIRLKHPAV